MIEENVNQIFTQIGKSCKIVHREASEVDVIAVTKSVSSEKARELLAYGIHDFAENRVDKMLQKQADFADISGITWHLIGNLQRRKVKDIINQIDYFHALDSIRLAEEINKRAEHEISCFVEVNVSGETTKSGISPADLLLFMESLADYPKIKVVGLMTMAPFEASAEEIRKVFKGLHSLKEQVEVKNLTYAPCHFLSMGMSQDFPIAIEEGATHVRIGTAFFK